MATCDLADLLVVLDPTAHEDARLGEGRALGGCQQALGDRRRRVAREHEVAAVAPVEAGSCWPAVSKA